MDNQVVKYFNEQFNLAVKPGTSTDELENLLAEKINLLILHDFTSLVQLLYRIDVNEKKLKNLIAGHPGTDAGKIIARLLIDRQLEKIRTREQFRSNEQDISEEDKW